MMNKRLTKKDIGKIFQLCNLDGYELGDDHGNLPGYKDGEHVFLIDVQPKRTDECPYLFYRFRTNTKGWWHWQSVIRYLKKVSK